MADRSIIISSEFADDFDYDMVVDDLSVWEFINPSSSDDDDDFSISDEGEEAEEGGGGGVVTEEPIKDEDGPVEFVGSPSSDISVEMEPSSADVVSAVVAAAGVVVAAVVEEDDEYGDNDVNGGGDEDEDDYDDYDDYNDGYDLDDELVPWGFSGKYGKQRIKKMAAKRACPKVKGSRKIVYRCAHGKDGIGLLHYKY